MAEIDPLIVELKAKVDQFERDLKRTTRTVDEELGRQGARARKLEDEFRRSSGAISSSIKGLAATLGAAFTGQELVGLIDSYTRLQNQLKVAGLEGQKLADVQGQLQAIGRTYGADLESLASTFSRIAQVQGDLGASTEDIIRLNEIVAASLKVAGTDAQTASGALLQLGQALGSGTVRAEEFNSILEGALPLAQAAARGIEGYGGSVAKLRTAIADGKVTSQEFFQGVLRGGVRTIEDAKNATLTLSGAFTALRNELTVYVGSNASASGATALLSGAIQSLADNLDLVAEALAVIALAIGTRYTVALGAAIVRTAGLSAAAVGLGVTLNGVAATARAAGAAVVTALGGPAVLAVGALAAGTVILATRFGESERAANAARKAVEEQGLALGTLRKNTLDAAAANDTLDVEQRQIITSVASLTGEVDKLSTAWGRVAAAAKQAAIEQAQAALDTALANQIGVRASSNVRREAFNRTAKRPFAERGLGSQVLPTNPREAIAAADRAAAADPEQARLERIASANVREAQRQLEEVRKRALATFTPAPASTPSATPSTVRSTGGGPRSAESDAEAANSRFLDELAAIQSRILSARAEQASNAEERAAFDRQQLELAEASALRSLAADEDLTEAQKAQLLLRLSELANAEREAIAFRERAEIEQRNAELADERGRAAIDALRLQFDLATTEKDRRSIALQILAAEQAILRERLQAEINSKTLNDIDKERARIALAALDAQAGAQKESVNRQFASPLERFAQGAEDSDQRIEEAAVRRIEDLNQIITDAMTNALGVKDPFLSQLIKIFLDKNVFGPLAEALSSQGSGGGDFFGSLFQIGASLFGRSSGGRVSAGSIYRVNEGASPGRVEAFRPDVGGQIIPLGRMNALRDGGAGGASGTVRVVIEEAPGFAAKVRTEAAGVAVEVVRQSVPQIVDAAANETFRRANRPGL